MTGRFSTAQAEAEGPSVPVEASGSIPVGPHILLQIWLSPAFPVGAFAYSHGLERAVDSGWVGDAASLAAWLAALVRHGALRNDLILLGLALRAARACDIGGAEAVDAMALALQPSAERLLEATQQGGAFLAQIDAAWPSDRLSALRARWAGSPSPAYPVAVGLAAGAHGLDRNDTARAYAVAWITSLASAAARLGIIGQTDAQRLIAGLAHSVADAVAATATATLDDLGGAAWRSDIASQQHETQYSRVFRS